MSALPNLSPSELQQDKAPGLIGLFVVFTILPLVAVGLRIILRRVSHAKLWWDDWLLLMASVGLHFWCYL